MTIDKRVYHVLVVEDNPGDFALVEDFLFEKIEAPVISHAKDYREAEKLLTDSRCPFDIVLLDLSLPDKTGEALIKAVVEICSGAPVIVLTGYADFSFGVKSLSLGVADYILKDELTSLSLYKSLRYSAERKKNIADIQDSEKRYSDVFHFSPMPMWVVDLQTLKFLDVNQATLDHYGYSREEFLSMSLRDIRLPEDLPGLESSFNEIRDRPDGIYKRLTVHKKKNGELMQVEVQFNQFMYKGVRSNIVIATDITERLTYLRAVEAQNEKLKEISWIQSHIVRAPLARLMGLVALLMDKKCSENERKEILSYLLTSANELDETIKAITEKTIIADWPDPIDN